MPEERSRITDEALRAQKAAIRAQAHAARNALQDRDRLSHQILARLLAMPEYAAAHTVMCYVSMGSEVAMHEFPHRAWADGKRVVVPYCVGGHLDVFFLRSLDQLAPGTWGILEPRQELRPLADHRVDPRRIDLIVTPGVAFDRHCGRVGHGKGYYDHFFDRVSSRAHMIGLAFECQVFDAVPMTEADVFLDKVVTENAVYERWPLKGAEA